MIYDDMPVGTVLRNPDDGDTYIRVVGLSGTWLRVQPGGDSCEVRGVEMVPFLVELVARPAPYVDGEGDRWEPATEPLYRIHSGLSDWLTRAQIEADFGRTEETPS